MMITFAQDDYRFTHRTVGIALNDGWVLLHRAETDDFWALPGGRVELAETAGEALQREMREELSIEVQVIRLVWVVENFFCYDQERHHELGFYFLVQLPARSPLYRRSEPFFGHEEGLKLIFQWFQLQELEQVRLYPSFLRRRLQALPQTIEHVVHVSNRKADCPP